MWKLLAILALLALDTASSRLQAGTSPEGRAASGGEGRVKGEPSADGETFTVSGTVKMLGEPPQPKENKAMQGDPKCMALCKDKVMRDDLVADKQGNLRWSFVYVKKGLEGKTFKAPEEPMLLDQVGCTYTPHVFGIQVGQPLNIRNSDPMMHNVNCGAFVNKQFNFAQAVQGQVNQEVFKQPEIGVPLACNVHSWMKATAHVMDHPFFAVSDAAGKFTIKGLPPGKYTLAAWHEKFKTVEQPIEVKADRTVDFTLADKNAP